MEAMVAKEIFSKPLEILSNVKMSEYEFEIPEEMLPWIEHQRDKHEKSKSLNEHYYILVNGKIKHANMYEWANWFEDIDNRIMERTEFEEGYVSTVFLGLDHNFNFDEFLEHRPILFETMVFGDSKLDGLQWRYSSLGEAKQGHYEIVSAIRENRDPVMDWGEEGFWSNFKKMFDD